MRNLRIDGTKSLITTIVIINICLISILYRSEALRCVQMSIICIAFYASCKSVEKYQKWIGEKRWRFLKTPFALEKFFAILSTFVISIAIWLDFFRVITPME